MDCILLLVFLVSLAKYSVLYCCVVNVCLKSNSFKQKVTEGVVDPRAEIDLDLGTAEEMATRMSKVFLTWIFAGEKDENFVGLYM